MGLDISVYTKVNKVGEAAQKLAQDFNEFETKAASVGDDFFAMYKQWQRAFNEGDVVQFH